MFAALGNATRWAIVDELAEDDGLTLFGLCTRLHARGITSSRQAITQHLTVLEDAGLVASHRDGRHRVHRLDLGPLHAAVDAWSA